MVATLAINLASLLMIPMGHIINPETSSKVAQQGAREEQGGSRAILTTSMAKSNSKGNNIRRQVRHQVNNSNNKVGYMNHQAALPGGVLAHRVRDRQS